MSIKDVTENKDFFLAEVQQEVVVESNGQKLIFYANPISFLDNQNIHLKAKQGKNHLSLMIAASITDKDGNKFTYDEANRLKEEFAIPFLNAVADITRPETEEKK